MEQRAPHSKSTEIANSGAESSDRPNGDLATTGAGQMRGLLESLAIGRRQIIGLGLLGLVIGTLLNLAMFPFLPLTTATQLAFAFPGIEKGEYPDHSKFQADDLRAPEIILQALKRQGLEISEENQAKIRGAISVQGIVAPNIVKERDRIRATGAVPPQFIPDAYAVSLTLPRKFPLSGRQRELLLNGIVSVYLQNFQETYVEIPSSFGNAFETLKKADFYEYEMLLNQDIQNLKSYLTQQMGKAPSFRSPTTHLSFQDLLQQTNLFSQIQMNETLGLIYKNGLSSNRETAMMKMDYYLRTLEEAENEAVAEEKIVKDLLSKAQERSENYVLGIKTQASEPRAQAPILDQGLIDSLLANDAYNFLVHRALDAGMKAESIDAEKSSLLSRRQSMETFSKGAPEDQTALLAQVQNSLAALQADYDGLTANVRKTNADFGRQEYGNAIRFAAGVTTENIAVTLAAYACIGAVLGLATGAGLSLLGYEISFLKRSA